MKCKKGDAEPLPLQEGEEIDIGGRVFEVILSRTYIREHLSAEQERKISGRRGFDP